MLFISSCFVEVVGKVMLLFVAAVVVVLGKQFFLSF